MPRPLLLLGMLLVVLPLQAETWFKVISPHFIVISNGNEKQAQEVAVAFEQVHAIFNLALPRLRTDSETQTIVIAAKNEQTFANLFADKKNATGELVGQFRKGPTKDYIIIRLNAADRYQGAVYENYFFSEPPLRSTRDIDPKRRLVFHEYVHKLLHLNFQRLPVWLDEGLAQFYSSTELHANEIEIGTPTAVMTLLWTHLPYPLSTLLSATVDSPYYRDRDKAQMFYAESWALTDFLMFAGNQVSGERVNGYLDLLQNGVESEKAFSQAFGDPAEIQKQFANYIHRPAFPVIRTKSLLNVDASGFTSALMSAAETKETFERLYADSGN